MAQLTIIRHGETEWSRAGRHTGRTDVPLTPAGEEQARAAGKLVADGEFGLVLVSPLRRARDTAALAALPDPVSEPDLMEWDYGGYEADVGARVDRVLDRVRPVLAGGEDVALVAHGHVLRILTARWLGLPPSDGRLFALATAGVSTLGFEHEQPVMTGWNQHR
ncbi:MAG: histidine phosphatase family protein [Streptomycetaceae bacterium]|nr:histidine phosphatase family protein [Streptomycetaceae bacterium]